MAVTKEQWAEIEVTLSGQFGEVKLKIDGYDVCAQVQRIAPLKYGVMIFVNGVSEGKWWRGEAEEAKKWLRKRGLSAGIKDYWKGVAERTMSHWYPYWTNPKAMTRQWRKTCTDIEVVKIGYGD